MLRQELISLEGLSRVSPDSTTDGEVHRMRLVAQSIDELEVLLGVSGGGWSSWQSWLLGLVSLASLITTGVGLWSLLGG